MHSFIYIKIIFTHHWVSLSLSFC